MLHICTMIRDTLTPLECVQSHGNEEYRQVHPPVSRSLPHYSFHRLHDMIKLKEVTTAVARYRLLAVSCPPFESPQGVQNCSK